MGDYERGTRGTSSLLRLQLRLLKKQEITERTADQKAIEVTGNVIPEVTAGEQAMSKVLTTTNHLEMHPD